VTTAGAEPVHRACGRRSPRRDHGESGQPFAHRGCSPPGRRGRARRAGRAGRRPRRGTWGGSGCSGQGGRLWRPLGSTRRPRHRPGCPRGGTGRPRRPLQVPVLPGRAPSPASITGACRCHGRATSIARNPAGFRASVAAGGQGVRGRSAAGACPSCGVRRAARGLSIRGRSHTRGDHGER
jgi:hypothetical protein